MRRDVKEQERYNKHWKLSMRRRVKYKSASHHSMFHTGLGFETLQTLTEEGCKC